MTESRRTRSPCTEAEAEASYVAGFPVPLPLPLIASVLQAASKIGSFCRCSVAYIGSVARCGALTH
jgi:hypothetical protein